MVMVAGMRNPEDAVELFGERSLAELFWLRSLRTRRHEVQRGNSLLRSGHAEVDDVGGNLPEQIFGHLLLMLSALNQRIQLARSERIELL